MHRSAHCIVCAVALLSGPPLAHGQDQTDSFGEEVVFTIFAAGRRVGTERVTLVESGAGWTIQATGALAPPFDLTTRWFEARYDDEWKPLDLTIEATFRDEPYLLTTTFRDTAVTNEITQGDATTSSTATVSPDAILLPNNFYAGYEAIAKRLAGAQPGAVFKVYVAPAREISARVLAVDAERIQTPAGPIAAHRYQLRFENPDRAILAEVTTDEDNRLVRIVLPSLQVIRADVASVGARSATMVRDNDESQQIPALGFSLSATVSRPASASGRLPAIVLVPGAGPQDREETVAGIPIFGHLAGELADAGFLVVRYDKRGVGQSGGRPESATLTDYAEDVRAIVKFLDDRDDVDSKRVALVGYGEGGLVSLLAAARERDIDALVLAATPGTTGADLVLEQQRRALDRLAIPDAEKQAKIDLQQRIQTAVIEKSGWEEIPPELRRQADTAWFRSFLTFDPAEVIERVRQPVMIVHGDLDTQVPFHHAERLAELARARDRQAPVELLRRADLNHLFVPASTGEIDEYDELSDRVVSPDIAKAIADWLRNVWP